MSVAERERIAVDPSPALELTQALVRIRSTAGGTGSRAVLAAVAEELQAAGVRPKLLKQRRHPLTLVAEIEGAGPGPTLCLNACADTAPIGDQRSWSVPPLGGEIVDGWLYGRGSADSKAGIAVFCEVIKHWAARGLPAGRLVVCFDGDEHTGRFEGIKLATAEYPDLDGVMIGYPGQDAIRTGARGFWRGSITVFGVGQHSGSRKQAFNAIVKATELVQELNRRAPTTNGNVGPQLTVTGIRGGTGFSTVPDSCVVRVDVRLTEEFQAEHARATVQDAMATIDRNFQYDKPSVLRQRAGWPPYELPDDAPVVQALSGAATEVLGTALDHVVAGPSNVGNLFAASGIPATCGFGVVHRAIHAPDESFEVASMGPTIATYLRATELFGRGPDRSSNGRRAR